ncbi:hypothetical protein [Nocardia crassostreae]|uniref:hypothetical protein n=1 Tax=Nocardia crassostreae TaxID=53428 RepID=UPI00082BC470|nr:hypothetical protein [Nocardia crassostreae]
MAFQVNPEGLRLAAGAIALLPKEIDDAPKLGAEPVAKALPGSTVGAALAAADPASRTAKDVLKARFNEFSAVLAHSANEYKGTDLDSAQRIAALADLNSGDPHAEK